MARIPLGSVEKYFIKMDPIGASSLSTSSWKIKVWARREIIIDKGDTVQDSEDKDKFNFFVDTSLIGKGHIRMQLLIDLIDYDYKEILRPQMPEWDTGDIVV